MEVFSLGRERAASMKIPYQEIWAFIELVDPGDGYQMGLSVGQKMVRNIPFNIIRDIRDDTNYDPRLLEVLFTEREVFWEPKESRKLSQYLIKLDIAQYEYQKAIEQIKQKDDPPHYLYAELLTHFLKTIEEHRKDIAEEGKATLRTIGRFRCNSLPFFIFFVEHPKTRKNEKKEALRKLNCMVNGLLTELRENFYNIETDPFWVIEEKKEEAPTRQEHARKVSPRPKE